MTDLNVAVRTLCEFAARKGDLDLRYTRRPRRKKALPATVRCRPVAGRGIKAKWRWPANAAN